MTRRPFFKIGLALLLVSACVSNKKLLRSIEDSRGPDARNGALSDSLNSEQRARLELLGRTSAPTRYTERTDANRVRVVALNFGGVTIGQCADPSGNLLDGICNAQQGIAINPDPLLRLEGAPASEKESRKLRDEIEAKVRELQLPGANSEKIQEELRTRYEKLEALPLTPRLTPVLHSGMFRQFSTQVGTTIETDLSIGPVGNTMRVYHSRNFLVLEWRRFHEERLIQPAERLESFNRKLQDLNESLVALPTSIKELAKLGGQLSGDVTQIQAKAGVLNDLVDEFSTKLAELGGQLSGDVTQIQAKVGVLNGLVDDFGPKLTALRATTDELNQKAEKLRGEKRTEVIESAQAHKQAADALSTILDLLRGLAIDMSDHANWLRDNGEGSAQTYVSAIEKGIAVRIIFDVQLDTQDGELSASFGIANLSAALARNEATVEVSYEVTGTAIDPLPKEAIIITSVNEYLDAFKEFHEAVSLISEAWEAYATTTTGDAPTITLRPKGTETPEPIALHESYFSLAQLAYYVQGPGVGDNFVLTKNAEMCQDMQLVRDYLEQEILRKRRQMNQLDCGQILGTKRSKGRRGRSELRELEREYKVLLRRHEAIRTHALRRTPASARARLRSAGSSLCVITTMTPTSCVST